MKTNKHTPPLKQQSEQLWETYTTTQESLFWKKYEQLLKKSTQSSNLIIVSPKSIQQPIVEKTKEAQHLAPIEEQLPFKRKKTSLERVEKIFYGIFLLILFLCTEILLVPFLFKISPFGAIFIGLIVLSYPILIKSLLYD